jgi:thiaminase/transcriptional activator TenA
MAPDVAATFDEYRTDHPDARFTEWLRELSEPMWSRGLDHRFVTELGEGTIDDDVFGRYLVQDNAFVEHLVGLIGHAVGDAPTMEQKRRIEGFLAVRTGDGDNQYFEETFEQLGVPESARTDPDRHPVTEAFADILARGAYEGDYEETLAVLLPTGWFYLEWGDSIADAEPGEDYLREWIDIHTAESLYDFVDWQRAELDELGPALTERRQRRVGRHFRRTMVLEEAFFDIAYDPDSWTHHPLSEY